MLQEALSGMPRKPREEVVDGIFHVYARGNDKRLIYWDEVDRQIYLQALGAVVERCRWRLLAFCLMDNHVHLLVETPDANLGTGMQRLHSDYAQQFNQRHGRSGHVFRGGMAPFARRRTSSCGVPRRTSR